MNLLPERAGRPLRKLYGGAKRRIYQSLDKSAPVPVYFKLEMMPACNLRCLHCDNWRRKRDQGRVPPERWTSLISEIAAWAGPCHLTISSGEPLLEPNIFPVIEAAQAAHISVTVVTNGTLLGREQARRFRAAGLRNLILSLDGMRPETHDRSRGVPGTHARVMAAVEHIEKEGLLARTQIQTIVAGHNLNELAPLTRWTRARGLAGIRFQALRPRGRAWKELWPGDAEDASRAVEALLREKNAGAPILNPRPQLEAMRRYYRNPSGLFPDLPCRCSRSMALDGRGGAYCCRYMEPIGNFKESSLRRIWSSDAAVGRLGAVHNCRKPCVLLNCHFPTDGTR